jgi:hypothetical protein
MSKKSTVPSNARVRREQHNERAKILKERKRIRKERGAFNEEYLARTTVSYDAVFVALDESHAAIKRSKKKSTDELIEKQMFKRGFVRSDATDCGWLAC